MYDPVVLWRRRGIQCVVIHHWDEHRYEIKVTQLQRTVVDRWFDDDQKAAAYASTLAREYGAELSMDS